MLSFYENRYNRCSKMNFFNNEMSLSLIKVLINSLHVFYCVLYLIAQRYVGSVVNWTDFQVVASHENRTDFDSEVT